ncbi:MAG TPA: serine/threonine protein phosphatase, partial [Flavobacteriaceae bacterium]|nr:serine/threonine protein phosphatase [Flavobacteriaceae bacterium]
MGIINKILDNAFNKAESFCINKDSKLIFFSDMHKGDNSYADDFAHNMQIYQHALQHYFDTDYTYFELGDGVELWENKSFEPIYNSYKSIFDLQMEFHKKNRLHLLFGNHDMIFKDKNVVEKMSKKLLFDVDFKESILLEIEGTDKSIFLIHGHQADFMNYIMWKFNRFLVRYLWMPLQNNFGFKDPTSPAKNYRNSISVEKKLKKWIFNNNNQIIICGHTHRPQFPNPGEIPYFNDGSCVHPKSI